MNPPVCAKNYKKSYNLDMKYFYLLLILLGLAACAGNPPEWWDPSGAYAHTKSAKENNATVAPGHQVASQNTVEIPAEESIEASVEEYEEMNLNPLEQTESSPSEEGSEQADPMYATAEDHIAGEGALPPPSVLE